MNFIQALKVEVSTSELLESYLRLACDTALMSTNQIAVRVVQHEVEHWERQLPMALRRHNDKPRNELPVVLLRGWRQPKAGEIPIRGFGGEEGYELFAGLGALSPVDQAMNHLQQMIKAYGRDWGAKFRSLVPEPDHDGSNSPGYRLSILGTYPETLAVSVVWIEYHK